MRASGLLRAVGLAITLIVVVLTGLVLASGLGTLLNFRVEGEKARISMGEDEIVLVLPYEAYNPGPLALEDVSIRVRFLSPSDSPITKAGEDRISVPPFSEARGVLRLRLKLTELGREGVVESVGEGYLMLETTVSGDVGGLASFRIVVKQPTAIRGG